MKRPVTKMNGHGFIPSESQPDHWHVGSGKARRKFGAVSLMPDGHGWARFKPIAERQNKNGLETYACTVYGTLNCYETLANFYGYSDFPKDCSDRFNAILAGITQEGGDIQRSCESIRSFASIPEDKLPFDDSITTWEQYYSPIPVPLDLVLLAKQLWNTYVLGHEWVFNGPDSDKPGKLKSALSRGPVAVAVYAWRKNADGLYCKSLGDEENHWVQLLDYVEGKYWIIYDDYEQYEKEVAWDTDFSCAKLFFLGKRVEVESMLTRLQRQLIYYLTQLVGALSAPQTPITTQPDTMPLPIEETAPEPVQELQWDTPQHAFHSTRVLCDDLGLSFEQKDILCACVFQESRFLTNPKPNINRDKRGIVWSTDYGIVQVNDYWNIGPNKPFPSVAYVLGNPDACIRWMIGIYKSTGALKPWASYTSGAYEQWLPKTSEMWALKTN